MSIDLDSILESYIALIILSLVHLVFSLIHYGSYDWIVQWSTSVGITHGVNYYSYEHDTTLFELNGVPYYPPNHFPVFFYVFALVIKISGYNRMIARGFLWLCSILLTFAIIKGMKLKQNKDKIRMMNYFLMSPILLGTELMGKFDQFVLLLLVYGTIVSLKGNKYSFFGGVILGLGVMSKIYPIFAVGIVGIAIMKEKKIQEVVLFFIGNTLVMGSIFYYFYSKNGESIVNRVLFWQLVRFDNSSSIWPYLRSSEIFVFFIWIQIFILMTAFVILIYFVDYNNSDTIFLSISTLFIIYILFSKIVYPHYMLWVLASGFPAVYSIKNNSQRYKSLWRGSLLFAFLGSTLWALSVELFINSIGFQLIGIVIQYLSLLVVLIINIKIIIKIKNSNLET